MSETTEQYITPAGLKGKRGWTDQMIRKLLGGPDKVAPNPHYRTAAPMRLYLVGRVEQAEKSGLFVRHEPDPRRQKAAAKAVQTKMRNLMRWAKYVRIKYDFPESGKLRGDDRQKVNYLRHECTAYDDTLASMYGVTGRRVAYPVIKGRMLEKIAGEFPELAGEARLQSAGHLAGLYEMPA